ncbi:MAG TPA: AAA family ATPase [Flavobacterium sp.]|nr:AAA family ATPase [Flavobacterium sp.]
MEENLFYREGYLERIKPFIGKHIIKILTGQRRVGKSYMLKLIIEEIKKSENANIIYIDKEQERFSEINNHIQLYNYVKNKLSNGTGIRQLHLREFLKQNEF